MILCFSEYTRTQGLNTGDISVEVVAKKRTLGLLFIIVEEIPNELLWRIWITEYCKEHDNVGSVITLLYYSYDN
ncbi:hypothetical protein EON65_04355 [archaeon]|nr:MAG: hypothetical protein EON65_04355 [archaeon]